MTAVVERVQTRHLPAWRPVSTVAEVWSPADLDSDTAEHEAYTARVIIGVDFGDSHYRVGSFTVTAS